ncbi:MAG: hypothetical protein ACPGGK_14805 [Pikeienuella sp.]
MSSIEITAVDQANAEKVFALVTDVFSGGSTLHRALGIGLEEYRAYLHDGFMAMVVEGLSVVAVEDGDLLGCMIVTDFHQHLGVSEAPDRFAPLAALTGELCRQYQQVRNIGPGEAALVDMGAVSSRAGGKGVYQKLRDAAQDRARQRGFRRIVGELSSAATQHVVLNRLGHEKLAEVRFADFEFGGAKPFAGIGEPESIILAEGLL